MSIIPRARIGVIRVLLMAVTLTSCDETVGIGTDFDARGTSEAMAGMSSIGTQTGDAFASLELAAPLIFDGTTSAALLPGAKALLRPAAAEHLALLQSQPSFPVNFLGVTFVYSDAEDGYVASDAPGAPVDGVRITYYAVDPISQRPATPLNALGYIDVRDLDTVASERIGLRIVRTSGPADVVLADYYVDARYSITSLGAIVLMEAPGFLADGTEQLDFELNQRLVVGESSLELTLDHMMALAGSNLSVAFEGELITDLEAGTLTYEMTSNIMGDDGGVIVVEMTADEHALSGEIRHGALRIANIGGTLEAPLFTDANGQPFALDEREHIRGLFDAVDALLALAAGIFATGETA